MQVRISGEYFSTRIVLNRNGTFSWLLETEWVSRPHPLKSVPLIEMDGEFFPCYEEHEFIGGTAEHELWELALDLQQASNSYVKEMNLYHACAEDNLLGGFDYDVLNAYLLAAKRYHNLWDRYYFPHLYEGKRVGANE